METGGLHAHFDPQAATSSGAAWSWSAGCQVLKRERDFHELMDLAHLQVETNPAWDTFTYTLINEEDLWT